MVRNGTTSNTKAIVSLFIIFILVNISLESLEVPAIQLFEHAICERFHRGSASSGDERNCKSPEIEAKLSYIMSVEMLTDAAPGLLVSVYGAIAESYGRRVVICMSITGILATLICLTITCYFNNIFPVETVWFSSAFLLVGGGVRVFAAMLTVELIDCDQSRRSANLYLLAASRHVIRILAAPYAFFLMGFGTYLPFYMSFATLAICIVFVWSTRNLVVHSNHTDYIPVGADTADLDNTVPTEETILAMSGLKASNSNQNFLVSILRDSIAVVKGRVMIWCMVVVFVKRIAFTAERFLFQYASERFGWILRDTTVLRVTWAFGAILSTLVFSPWITTRLLDRGWAAAALDMTMSRAYLGVATFSFFGSWLSPNGQIFSVAVTGGGIAEAVEPAIQGLAASCSPPGETLKLFTVIAFIDTVASMISGPITGGLMGIGRKDGRPSNGAFLLASSIMCGVLWLWGYCLRTHRIQVASPKPSSPISI